MFHVKQPRAQFFRGLENLTQKPPREETPNLLAVTPNRGGQSCHMDAAVSIGLTRRVSRETGLPHGEDGSGQTRAGDYQPIALAN